MSLLIVEVCQVDAVEKHPQADRLAVAVVKGWKTCIRYDPETKQAEFQVGQKCIFFPPDAILPPELANSPDKVCKDKGCHGFNKPYNDGDLCLYCGKEITFKDGTPGRLGVMSYCAPIKNEEGKIIGGRVRACRLRGHQSFGFIMAIDPEKGDDPNWAIGTDVKDHFGVTKWEPIDRCTDGDAETPSAKFHKYTDIEHWANYPHAFTDNEEVVFTEKIHGKNCRLGLVLEPGDDGQAVWTWMAGSHDVRRKEFDQKGRRSEFWEQLTEPVKLVLEHFRDNFPWNEPKFSIIMFCEIFGSGVQDIGYGYKNGHRSMRVFDVAINGKYIDHCDLDLLSKFTIQTVPTIYRGPYSIQKVEEYTSGPTTLCPPEQAGKFKGREGIVIVPLKERTAQELICTGTNGRLILKSVSSDYLARKDQTDNR